MATVLLVEDDATVRAALTRALSNAGHAVRPVGAALEALRHIGTAGAGAIDLVILDLGLPDLDGADALRMLRGITDVPVIVATARNDETSMIRLLNAGADDYVTKPFSAAHLQARVAAVLRRGGQRTDQPAAQVTTTGSLRIDQSRRHAELDGTALDLTRREFDLLAYLAEHAGRVVTRRELVEQVWRQPYLGAEATVDVHLSWLRRKLGETAASPQLLRTVRGVGVMLVDERR